MIRDNYPGDAWAARWHARHVAIDPKLTAFWIKGWPKRTRSDVAALRFIVDFKRAFGFAPTVDEVAIALGVVKSSAYRRLQRMGEEGLVDMYSGKVSRTLALTLAGMEVLDKRVAA